MDLAVVEELKRIVVALPLETNAVSSVASRLSSLHAPAFAMLLKELACDNHAFRHARGSPDWLVDSVHRDYSINLPVLTARLAALHTE